MDERVARPTNVESTRFHIFFIKVLFEPLIGVTRAGDEVMKGYVPLAAAQGAQTFIDFSVRLRHS